MNVKRLQALVVWDPDLFANPPDQISHAQADGLIKARMAFCIDKAEGHQYSVLSSIILKHIDSILARMKIESSTGVGAAAAIAGGMHAIADTIRADMHLCTVSSVQAKRILLSPTKVSASAPACS
jgi:hypothetical protein